MDIVVAKLNFYITMIYIHTIWTDLKFLWLVKKNLIVNKSFLYISFDVILCVLCQIKNLVCFLSLSIYVSGWSCTMHYLFEEKYINFLTIDQTHLIMWFSYQLVHQMRSLCEDYLITSVCMRRCVCGRTRIRGPAISWSLTASTHGPVKCYTVLYGHSSNLILNP